MYWSPDNIIADIDGTVCLALGASPRGYDRAYCGAEIRLVTAASTGTWSWTAQAPIMEAGAVFGMFTYKADWQNDPWIEFDFEFVGADTRCVQLNIHMETINEEHVTLEQANGGRPVVVELDFDAAAAFHLYEITITESEVIFSVDCVTVGRFSAKNMPNHTWIRGDMHGFANVWCVDSDLQSWAGEWRHSQPRLIARLAVLNVRQ